MPIVLKLHANLWKWHWTVTIPVKLGVFCYIVTFQITVHVLWINVYKLSKLQIPFWNTLYVWFYDKSITFMSVLLGRVFLNLRALPFLERGPSSCKSRIYRARNKVWGPVQKTTNITECGLVFTIVVTVFDLSSERVLCLGSSARISVIPQFSLKAFLRCTFLHPDFRLACGLDTSDERRVRLGEGWW
jgi:hypothetical protein